jgi:steroid 5-alpha reductase family enzyme
MIDSSLLIPGVLFFAYMSVLWLMALLMRNYGWVDFGWPSGFTAIAIYFAFIGEGLWERKLLILSLYGICGARFMIGWAVRNIRDGEDRRWSFWRERWQKGEGLFGIRSVSLNLFAFYQTQTFATVFVLITPLVIACRNDSPQIYWIEWAAVAGWLTSFLFENIADVQLDKFRKRSVGKGGLCRTGFWRYSRHPNYFFEFLIWVFYAIFALPSATGVMDYVALILVPITAYWFLVHFTGIPITELASLQRRGQDYADYCEETNRFFPWLPKKNVSKANR